MTECPCEGIHPCRNWHRRRGLPNCDHVKAYRAKEQRERMRRIRGSYNPEQPREVRIPWQPGTSILVPEYEEP